MMSARAYFGTTAAIAALSASSVFADVTNQQVWTDWHDYMADFGYKVSATEATSGDTLTIGDLSVSMDIPEEDGSITISVGEVTFTNQNDGTVAIGMPADFPVHFVVDAKEDATATLNWTSKGLSMIASGDTDQITYTYSASMMGLSLADLEVDGEPFDSAVMELVANNYSARSTMSNGTLRTMEQKSEAENLSLHLGFVDPASGDNMTFKIDTTKLAFEGGARIPTGLDSEDPLEMFQAGFGFAGTFQHSGSEGELSGVADGSPFNLTFASAASDWNMAMDSDKFDYSGLVSDIAISAFGSELPFPVSMNAAQLGFGMLMPLAKADEHQDFGFNMHLGDLEVADILWDIFDPAKVLPRDPATLTLDLSGKTKVLLDLMSPEAEETDDFPGELHALTLNKMLLQVAGAKLSGDGDFTFDNSDLVSFDGMPRPTGAVDLNLMGGNGLLDKLVQMGLIPDDQAMGARMMMGLFAVPGAGEDELNSKIEFNEEGHVLANGQRIQ